ncbi:MAG: hypothetical protein KatS3mg054_0155 [Chloroflexus sp.]|nr:MAG: hypothetical protein KatS3mg054_0155 [Chloroflexus sp.]
MANKRVIEHGQPVMARPKGHVWEGPGPRHPAVLHDSICGCGREWRDCAPTREAVERWDMRLQALAGDRARCRMCGGPCLWCLRSKHEPGTPEHAADLPAHACVYCGQYVCGRHSAPASHVCRYRKPRPRRPKATRA